MTTTAADAALARVMRRILASTDGYVYVGVDNVTLDLHLEGIEPDVAELMASLVAEVERPAPFAFTEAGRSVVRVFDTPLIPHLGEALTVRGYRVGKVLAVNAPARTLDLATSAAGIIVLKRAGLEVEPLRTTDLEDGTDGQ